MLKGAQNQIKIVRVTSKLSHWDLWLKCDIQDNNLKEYPDIDADLGLQCNQQDNYLLKCPDLEAVLRLKSNEQDNHLQEDPDLEADIQEYTDLEVGLRLKCNEQDNHLQEYLDVGPDMQEYTEEGNNFEEYSEEYEETNVEESILPELYTVRQHSKVKIEIKEELDSFDNLTQVKEEVLSDIDIDESENDTTDYCDINIRVKEDLNESQLYKSTHSIFDDINKHSKEVDAIAKYFEKVDVVPQHYNKVKNSLKTEKTVDEVPKSSKLDAISGTELWTVKYNVCLNGFLGDEASNEHMKNHITKDISPAEVIPSNGVIKVGNPLADNWAMVKVKKIRVKRLAKAKADENKTTKKYFTRSSLKNIVYSTSTQNDIYSTIRNDKNDEVDDDSSTVKVCSNKSVKVNSDSSVAIDNDNDRVKIDNDSKVKVDEEYDNSTGRENKSLLIETPGKTKGVILPKGKRKQPEERSNRLYNHHYNVTYKVCDESCTNKKFFTQSKECRSEQRTKQDINMRFACTQCDYKVNWKHHLDRHILLNHKGGKNFHCNLCDYICFRRCYLVRHMRAHLKTKTYSCDFCDYECVQKCQLNQHMQRHAGVKPFSCTKSKKYASRNSAKNIVYSNTIQSNNYSSVRNDNNVEVGRDNKFKVVDENDSSTGRENKDLLIEIPGKTKVVKQPKGKRKQPEERTKRLFKHHINATYKVCDKSCTNKKLCTQSKECRMKQRTKQYNNTRFACPLCDYKGSQKNHLGRHMLTHNGVKNFRCNLCDYKCVQQCHLDQHMRTHSKTKPYSCNLCDYNCVQRSQLNQHMRRHTGVKPFSCNICEYTCTQRCHLDQHMRIHTGTRPFSCIHCDYKFVQQSHLNKHIMKMHKKVQVYECSHCRYQCLQLELLVRHMNIH